MKTYTQIKVYRYVGGGMHDTYIDPEFTARWKTEDNCNIFFEIIVWTRLLFWKWSRTYWIEERNIHITETIVNECNRGEVRYAD